jgi:hypothetical protein
MIRCKIVIENTFRIAPVPLNLEQKEPNLVGLGSDLVNAVNDYEAFITSRSCRACRTLRMIAKIRTACELSRVTLTPDKTGRPESGQTFAEFRQIIRSGKVRSSASNCTATITTNCIRAFTGSTAICSKSCP